LDKMEEGAVIELQGQIANAIRSFLLQLLEHLADQAFVLLRPFGLGPISHECPFHRQSPMNPGLPGFRHVAILPEAGKPAAGVAILPDAGRPTAGLRAAPPARRSSSAKGFGGEKNIFCESSAPSRSSRSRAAGSDVGRDRTPGHCVED